MSKVIVAQADSANLRQAVCEIMDVIWTEEYVNPAEFFDRLVQVSAVGKYTAPETVEQSVEEALRMADELIDKSNEEEVQRFRDILDGLPDAPDPEYGDEDE